MRYGCRTRRRKEVRFIAINNGIDSDRQETSEFAPFLNIMNEWFVRDTSSPAHRGRSIKLFRGGYKLHIVLLKQLHHRCKVQNRAAYTVQLVHDDPPDLSFADLAQQLLKLRSVRILTGIAFVLKYPAAPALQFILAKVDLTFNADTVLAVY